MQPQTNSLAAEATAEAEPTETLTVEPTETADVLTLNTETDFHGLRFKVNNDWLYQESDSTIPMCAYAVAMSSGEVAALSVIANGGAGTAVGDALSTILADSSAEAQTVVEGLKETALASLVDVSSEPTTLPEGAAAAWTYSGTDQASGNNVKGWLAFGGQYLYQIMQVGTEEAIDQFAPVWNEMIASISIAVDQSSEATLEVTPAPADAGNVTTGQKNALAKAESYLRVSAFADSELRDQLEYNGFTPDEIEYAMNNITVDWNEQARKKAESYLRVSSFSRNRLIEQLEYNGFTPEQAEQAVAAVYD